MTATDWYAIGWGLAAGLWLLVIVLWLDELVGFFTAVGEMITRVPYLGRALENTWHGYMIAFNAIVGRLLRIK